MRSKSIFALFTLVSLAIGLIAGGCRVNRRMATAHEGEKTVADKIAPSDGVKEGQQEAATLVDKGGDGIDLAEREEIRRTYKLEPGARVEISGISGRVDVETANTDIAEVLIIRSAKKREDLQYRKINIQHRPDYLSIGIEGDHKSIWSAIGSRPEGRQRVILKMPRQVVELETRGVTGDLTVGELDGGVDIGGVNGRVKIAKLTGTAEFHGVNGNITANIAKLSSNGVEINGVNGNTEILFIGEVNANVETRGMNGRVDSDLPNVEVKKAEGFGRYMAQIGSGGPKIEARGVNGNVFLGKAVK
jgi:hypothetical protein